ncbi:MAG: lipid-binding SYLF domain-containing protein [Bryobacteraceae bacterium]|nr:lipid-binding SYLF domain-containing protein [Bryobacteraceae bacterium]
MQTTNLIFTTLAITGIGLAAEHTPNQKSADRLHAATLTFEEIMATPDKAIPQDLLERSHCVVIIPGMKKAGFIVGAKYGKGFISCRKHPGSGWSNPAAMRLEGGSVGLQIGVGETDLVLLIMNERGEESLMKSEFKIGGSASAMAGPVGRTAQAETDAFMRAEILGYSRSRGLFAGIALEGSTLRQDLDENEMLYGKRYTTTEILRDGKGRTPATGAALLSQLNKYSFQESKK